MYQVTEPVSEEEFARYYHFRWMMLRAPFQLAEGSERDEYDPYAHHRMICDKSGQPMAVGRLYRISADEAQIRFMAVADEHRGNGLGSSLVAALEDLARGLGVKRIVLNARLQAQEFYERNGYHPIGEGPTHFGKIQHQQMQKELTNKGVGSRYGEWCHQLQTIWHEQIPLTVQMGVEVVDYNGSKLQTKAPLPPNINLHGGLFAGSVYSLGSLTAWGLAFLMLRERQIKARILMAQGEIRYLHSIHNQPRAEITRTEVQGRIWPLIGGRRVVLNMPVKLYDEGQLCAEFSGKYILHPTEPPRRRRPKPGKAAAVDVSSTTTDDSSET